MADETKIAIADSFRILAQSNSLSKITVQEIAKLAGVSRHTFYYHFRDIYALTEWIFESEGSQVIADYKKLNNWKEGLERACRYALDNRVLVIRIYHSDYQKNIIMFFQNVIKSIISNIVETEYRHIIVKPNEKEMLLDFYTFGCVGLLSNWLSNNMEEDYHMILDKLHTIIHGSVKDVLLRFSGEKV